MKTRYYLTVAACCGLIVASVGLCHNVDGVYYSAVCSELGLGRGTVSAYATITVLTTALVCPFTVRIINSQNARLVMSGGALLTALSVAGLGFSRNIYAIYFCALLRGVGCSAIGIVMTSVILRNWFKDRFAAMNGIAMGFAGITGMIASPAIAAVIERFSYHIAFYIAAVLIFLFSVPGILFVIHFRSEDVGLKPYEEGRGNIDLLARGSEDRHSTEPPDYRSPLFIALCLSAVFSAFITSFVAHLVGFAESFGLYDAAAYLLSGAMAGNVLFKFLYGHFIDRFGAVKVSLFGNMMHLIVTAAFLAAPKTPAFLIILSVLFGSCSAVSSLCINAALATHIYGTENYPKVSSIISMFSGSCAAFGFAIFGYIFDASLSYTPCILICIALDLLSYICIVYIKRVTEPVFVSKTQRPKAQ